MTDQIVGKHKFTCIHCSDTPPSIKVNKAWLHQVHIVGNGWSKYGYSDVIHRDGIVENITPYNEDGFISYSEVTWGIKGLNYVSKHICLEGGRYQQKNNSGRYLSPTHGIIPFTQDQLLALWNYLAKELERNPDIIFAGHYQFNKWKTCPNMNVPFLLHNIFGISMKNIYHV